MCNVPTLFKTYNLWTTTTFIVPAFGNRFSNKKFIRSTFEWFVSDRTLYLDFSKMYDESRKIVRHIVSYSGRLNWIGIYFCMYFDLRCTKEQNFVFVSKDSKFFSTKWRFNFINRNIHYPSTLRKQLTLSVCLKRSINRTWTVLKLSIAL